ncbi:hypothetical protein BVG80_16265 [Sphingobacteriales bacterium TSM_CSM]|nr:hypothetical protein BVG80_16265 [Sphingobacteriales bacterium TSM_CSM]
MRIVIVGTTGSGKSTLAAELGARLNIAHIELDYYHFEENWREVPDEVFRERVSQLAKPDGAWITDGNYSVLHDITWQRANVLIWLNYSFGFTFARLLKRTLQRIVSQKPLWHGNRETFSGTFATKNSILYWFFKTYYVRRRKYPVLFRQPQYAHLKVIEITRPANALQQVLQQLKALNNAISHSFY